MRWGDRRWEDQSACLDWDPGMFPDHGKTAGVALAVCAGCPVRMQCAVVHMNEGHGVFGGMTARERKRWRMGRQELIRAAHDALGIEDASGWLAWQRRRNEEDTRELERLARVS